MAENPHCKWANEEVRKFMEVAAQGKSAEVLPNLIARVQKFFDKFIRTSLPEEVRNEIMLVIVPAKKDSALNFLLFDRRDMIGTVLKHNSSKIFRVLDVDRERNEVSLERQDGKLVTKPVTSLLTQFSYR